MCINITYDFPQIERHYIRSYLYADKNYFFYCCLAMCSLNIALSYKKTFDVPATLVRIANLLTAHIRFDTVYPQYLSKHTTVATEDDVKQSKKALAYLTVEEVAKKYDFFEKCEECPEDMTNKCEEYISTIKPTVPEKIK